MSLAIHPKKIEQIGEKFRAFLDATSVSEDWKDHVFMGRAYGRNNAVLTWSHQPYQEAIEAIKQLDLRVSDKAIARALSASMRELFESQAVSDEADPEVEASLDSILPILETSAIRAEVDKLLVSLTSSVKIHTVFIPFEGVELKDLQQLPIAQATLYPSNSGPVPEALFKQNLISGIRERLEKAFAASACYAVVEIEAESALAVEEAVEAVQDVAHILNMMLATSYHRHKGYRKIVPFSWAASAIESMVYADSPLDSLDVDTTKWSSRHHRPYLHNYEITREKLGKWAKWGLEMITDCFAPVRSRGELESKIRQAVIWYGKAMNADSTEERYLAVAIALESLLVGKGEGGGDPKVTWGSIAQRLADRVAFLVGQDFEECTRLVRETKRLYGLRSKIVHEGMTVSRQNLYLLERLFEKAFWAFVALAGEQIKSWPDFQQWEKQQKYSVHEKTDEKKVPA